ncbi:ShlB/FhaC/HecB family hemolysin secretion/activation protein, partial [Sphingomonas sp.]|uniref:ShlB/FhaC/HecB family hemolysin secretion/activation protein n=1 Tax=Sphingomonas sp. TaxID=28214 RepID=UPI001D1CA406
ALLRLVPQTDFRAVLIQASHARRLTAKGLELRLRLTGQWADGILYSGERLAAGGEFTVRGYRETLALVDRGVIGSVELYQPLSLFGRGAGTKGVNLGAFGVSAFADGAFLNNAVDPQPQSTGLASIGTSLAWIPSDAVTARVSYAYSLIDVRQVGSVDLQDRGFQFRVTIHPLAPFRKF